MRPYELPDQYIGFALLRIECPVCGRKFKTTIHVSNFLGDYGGSFYHYPDDGGCGSNFRVLELRGERLIVEVVPRGARAYRAEIRLFS